ncbi:MAG: GNAT family N-acetyltransferase [Bacillota bacterium]
MPTEQLRTLEPATIQTPRGLIVLEGPVRGDYINSLELEEKLDNFRPPPKQKKALIKIADSPDGQVYLARHEKTIIAYISFHFPDEFSRWSKHPAILELGAIEVSPNWRNISLGKRLLNFSFQNPLMEDMIVITIEYCWHWDLDSTRLDIWEYQRMLARLFGSVGFERILTDDPDILEHICNVLMARIGKNAPPVQVKMFYDLQFVGGQKPDR